MLFSFNSKKIFISKLSAKTGIFLAFFKSHYVEQKIFFAKYGIKYLFLEYHIIQCPTKRKGEVPMTILILGLALIILILVIVLCSIHPPFSATLCGRNHSQACAC